MLGMSQKADTSLASAELVGVSKQEFGKCESLELVIELT